MSAGAGVLYTLFEGHEENDGPTFWVLLRQFSEPEENPEVQMKGIPGIQGVCGLQRLRHSGGAAGSGRRKLASLWELLGLAFEHGLKLGSMDFEGFAVRIITGLLGLWVCKFLGLDVFGLWEAKAIVGLR